MRRKWVLVVALGSILLLQNCTYAFVISPSTTKDSRVTSSKQEDAEESSIEAIPLLKPLEQEIQNFQNKVRSSVQAEGTSEAGRIFHGRGDSYPGLEHLTLDWFPPVWLLTSHNLPLSNDTVSYVQDILEDNLYDSSNDQSDHNDGHLNLVYQFRNDTGSETRIVTGTVPKPHVVTENGMKFLVGLLSSGKNHGIFLDMANGRKWVQENTKDQNVLNMFAYTCGFSVAALKGGASQVVNIDMAGGPMKNGKRNHELNDLKENARFLTHNIFKTWGKLRKLGTSIGSRFIACYKKLVEELCW